MIKRSDIEEACVALIDALDRHNFPPGQGATYRFVLPNGQSCGVALQIEIFGVPGDFKPESSAAIPDESAH